MASSPRRAVLGASSLRGRGRQPNKRINQDDKFTAAARGRAVASGNNNSGGGAWKGKASALVEGTRLSEWRTLSSRNGKLGARVLNAVLSHWPIKRWKAQRIVDHSGLRLLQRQLNCDFKERVL
ncbi:unnamed protein product [Urochloa humidicola]